MISGATPANTRQHFMPDGQIWFAAAGMLQARTSRKRARRLRCSRYCRAVIGVATGKGLVMAKIIAEIGSSCDGAVTLCCAFAGELLKAGADYIKLQCHYGQRIPPNAQHPAWDNGGCNESRYDYLCRNEWTEREWEQIARVCPGKLIVSPFSVEAARRVEPYVCMWKIASGQVSNRQLLDYLELDGRDVLWSDGMGTCARHMSKGTELLCVSAYPTEAGESPAMRCGHSAGYSSHDGDPALPLAAIALGAPYVEVHVKPSDVHYGTDAGAHALSLEAFAWLCGARDALEAARGAEATEPDKRTLDEFLWREPGEDWLAVRCSRE